MILDWKLSCRNLTIIGLRAIPRQIHLSTCKELRKDHEKNELAGKCVIEPQT